MSEQTPDEGAPQQPQQPQPTSQGSAGAMEMGAAWLRGDGESHDVVMSSRVRLARNLAGRPFATKATRRDRVETMQVCRDCVMNAGLAEKIIWVDIHGSPALERQLLVERHLISKNHGKGRGQNPNEDPRGVAISVPDERLAIMVNEEDHLRLQAIRSGLALSDAWSDVDSADDKIESRLTYVFSSKFGYLTACPTNVGTGLRMSVMLHLPGLRLTGEIEKVKRAATDMALAVRGFYGEGSEPVGDLFQISNQATLGKSEAQVLHELERQIVPRVVEYERLSRRELLAKRRVGLEDQVWRSWGMLSSARLLTTEEAMGALSLLRLGVSMGLLRGAGPGGEGPSMRVVNQLMLLVQPAHLQRAVGRELDQEQRRTARATLVRTKLTRPRVA